MFEPVQCRIERTLIDLQNIFGNLLNPLGYGPPVQRRCLQRAKDQEVERSREKVRNRVARHGVDCRHYTPKKRPGRFSRPGRACYQLPPTTYRLESEPQAEVEEAHRA